MADARQIGKICDIVVDDPQRRIVVVSAPGKRFATDVKVTDLLISCAEARLSGESVDGPLQAVMLRFEEICKDLGVADGVMEDIEQALRRVVNGPTDHAARYQDAVKAAGEDNCARLVAGELCRRGHDAHYVNPGEAGMLLSDEYGHAQLLPEAGDRLARLKDREGITVFPGFFGYTPDGQVVTFSRGGSDVTGAILAAAVKAELYENFTDVDSVYAADPRVIENPVPVKEITYREMRELSYAGFGVLHDEAIIPAVRAGIPINIKNTNSPQGAGTLIVPEHRQSGSRVVGLAASAGFCTIYISKYLMNREIGFGRRLLQLFEEEGVSYEHTPSGIDNMSVIVHESSFSEKTENIICKRIIEELQADDVCVERGLALVMIVGEGMRFTVGLAEMATRALAEANVNIEMMNQGSSEISMMFGVKAEGADRALQSLYKAFFE